MTDRHIMIRIAMPVITLLACTPHDPARLAADVDRYLGAMQAWAVVERETGQAIERIIATHFVDETEVLRQLDDSRPRIRRHLHALEAYRPDTPDVRAVHRQYVETWRDLLAGYQALEEGLGSADPAAIAAGRTALLAWRRGLRTVAQDLRDLADVSGVTVQKREGPA